MEAKMFLSQLFVLVIIFTVCNASPGGMGGRHRDTDLPSRVPENDVTCLISHGKTRVGTGKNSIIMFKELRPRMMDDDMEGDMDGEGQDGGEPDEGEPDGDANGMGPDGDGMGHDGDGMGPGGDGDGMGPGGDGDGMGPGGNGRGHGPKFNFPLKWKFIKLEEVTAEGTVVEEHVLPDFNDLEYECDDTIEDETIPNSEIEGDATGEIPASKMLITTTIQLNDVATEMMIHVYIAQANGTISNGDESSEIKEGQVKFSVHLSEWAWADDGAGLWLTLGVDSRGPPRRKAGQQQRRMYELEGGAEITFSNKAMTGGVFVDLAEDVEVVDVDGKDAFEVKFARFAGSITYDPSVETGDEEYEDEETGGGGGDECDGETCGAPAWTSFTLLTALIALVASWFNF